MRPFAMFDVPSASRTPAATFGLMAGLLAGAIVPGLTGVAAGIAVGALAEYLGELGGFDDWKKLNFPPTHPGRWDPLVVDLNGDGVKLTPLEGSKINFDFGADGFAEQTGWVSAQDGLVVFDRNKNGRIDNGTELFGNANEDGFAALAKFDHNKDGVIDARDAVFANLRIWRDANGNGLTDAGELLTLAQAERHRIARGHWPSIRSRRALNRLRVRSQNGWYQVRLHSARGRLSCDKPGREYRPIKCVMGG